MRITLFPCGDEREPYRFDSDDPIDLVEHETA